MSEDWAAISADVIAAIADVGFDVTFTRRTSGPATPHAATAIVPTVTAVKAIDAKPRWMRVGGTNEITNRRAILMATGVLVPVAGDQITVRSRPHTIASVRAIAPGGVDLMYIVELSE